MSSYKDAKRALVNREFFETQNYIDQKIRARREGAHPDIILFERKLIARFKKMNIPLFTHCIIRSNEDQRRLFDKGRSKARAGQSAHNCGMAADIVHSVLAWELPDRKCWDLIGHIGKEVAAQSGIQIEWGGDWEFYDPAHWQLAHWKVRHEALTQALYSFEGWRLRERAALSNLQRQA